MLLAVADDIPALKEVDVSRWFNGWRRLCCDGLGSYSRIASRRAEAIAGFNTANGALIKSIPMHGPARGQLAISSGIQSSIFVRQCKGE